MPVWVPTAQVKNGRVDLDIYTDVAQSLSQTVFGSVLGWFV
jgi:hypothetical protein